MNQTIFCGRGHNQSTADLMELLNISFNFTEPDQLFQGLLPKCYREEYRPQDSNYVVVDENGVLAAAVGAYDHEMVVCGRRLPCRGIGNVAVHPDHRKKGYMKLAMDRAMADMVADGIALSTLGGRRQRYQYFGYDKAGEIYSFGISPQNIHHLFHDRTSDWTVREVTDPADPVIDEIIALNRRQPVVPTRPRETYLDIANSWRAKLLAVSDGERFVGYAIRIWGSTICEIQTLREEDLMETILALYGHMGGAYTVQLPAWQHAYAALLAPVAEDSGIGNAMYFNILDYRAVVEAFLAVKLTYTALPEGEITFLIHGYARDERIRVTVKDGEAAVETIPDSVAVDYELSHLEAVTFLFAPVCPARNKASDLARIWFPLPISMFRADEV
jgi:GNAT superfamily N-acetyltransferase